MIKAAFFDLDDTLCDDSAAWIACARKAAAHGVSRYSLPINPDKLAVKFLEISEHYWSGTQYMSETRSISDLRTSQYSQAIVEVGLPENPLASKAMADEYSRIRSREIDLFADALPTLAHLRRLGVCTTLITNGLVSTHVEKVENLGLTSAVDHVIIAEAVGFWKPDPRIFEHALSLCNVSAQDALMVGDSITSDVGGAQSAGVRAFWYNPHGRTRDRAAPEPTLGELRSLAELLERPGLFWE